MTAALLHIRTIGTLEDEIKYLNSERSAVEFVSGRYKSRFGKYGVNIDEGKLHTPDGIRAIILHRLEEAKKRARKQASILVVVAAVTAILAVFLLDLGL